MTKSDYEAIINSIAESEITPHDFAIVNKILREHIEENPNE